MKNNNMPSGFHRIEIKQGSYEWLMWRKGVATASNFSKLLTDSGKISKSKVVNEYALSLAGQELSNELEDTYKSPAMQRGNDLESFARALYQEETLSVVEQVGFITDGEWGYSPDGFVGDDGLIEIKCPLHVKHTEYLLNNCLPSEYQAQVQGGLMITGRKWCDFISYNPVFVDNHKISIVRVERDEEYIQLLRDALVRLTDIKKDMLNKLNFNYQKKIIDSRLIITVNDNINTIIESDKKSLDNNNSRNINCYGELLDVNFN